MLKRYTLLLLYIFFTASFWPLSAQEERRISYQGESQALLEVLHTWEKEYSLVFAYESSLVDDITVSAQFENQKLSDALQHLLSQTSISFEIVSPRYIILRRSEALIPLRSLCGKVVDSQSGEALAFASIGVAGTNLGTHSDEDGNFAFRGNFEAVNELIISYVGYESQKISIGSLLNQPCASISLKSSIKWIPEIIVQEFTVDMLDFGKYRDPIKMRPEKIPTLPGWGEPDVLRSLQLLPGVSTTGESAANINIRGGSPDQNLILWDGIPIYHSGHFFGLYSAFNPYVVQEVDVYRGGFGAEYGGRISGVIDIKGKPSLATEPHFGFGLNFINAHAFAEIPLLDSKSSLLFAARRSYTDLIQSSTYQNLFNSVFQKGRINENINDDNEAAEAFPDFHYEDYHAKWVWKPYQKQTLAVSTYYGNDSFDFEFEFRDYFLSEDRLKLRNWGINLQSLTDWNERSQTTFEYTYSSYLNRYNFKYSFEPKEGTFNSLSHLNRLGDAVFRLHHTWKPHPRFRLLAGWEYSRRNIRYEYQEALINQNQEFGGETFSNRTNSFYGDITWEALLHLELQFGLRRDGFRNFVRRHFEIRDDLSWQARYSIRWNPGGKAWSFKFNGGNYSQFLYQIPVYYNDLGAGEQLWVSADDYFPVLHARQWSWGIAYQKADWQIEAEFYLKNTKNLSSRRLEFEDGLENPFNQAGQARARGMDILLRKKWSRFSLWLAYSLSQVMARFPEFNQDDFFPANQDQRHRLTISPMLNLKHWDISASWQFRSGAPFSFPIGFEEFRNDNGNLEFFPTFDGPNNARLQAYHRLDIAANYKFYRKKWQGKIGLSILNLYNRQNIFDIDYFVFPPDLQAERYVPQTIGFKRQLLRFTPNLFFQIEW